jgi:hypothetical protein
LPSEVAALNIIITFKSFAKKIFYRLRFSVLSNPMPKNLRQTVVSNVFSGVISSILAKCIFLTIFCCAFAVIKGYLIILILPLLIFAWNWRSIVFEFFLLTHIIEESLGIWTWFSKIDRNLYLGAIPMQSMNHLSILTMDHKVDAVLSVMETYELTASTLAGKPVSPEQWKVIPLCASDSID